MPVWGALAGTLGFNYWRHKHGRSTLCSSTRRVVPPLAFVAAWGVLTQWLVKHYVDGFKIRIDLDRLTD